MPQRNDSGNNVILIHDLPSLHSWQLPEDYGFDEFLAQGGAALTAVAQGNYDDELTRWSLVYDLPPPSTTRRAGRDPISCPWAVSPGWKNNLK